jgi:hypothetical protein
MVCAGNFIPPSYAAEAAALMVERGARTENLLHCFVRVELVAALDAVGSLFPEESCFADLLLIENDAMRQRIGNH